MAFCGVLGLSFSGRLDTLDWTFYWGDVASMLLLPPLFAHFALVFPERPDSWARTDAGRTLLPLLYLPGLLLGGARVATFVQGRPPRRDAHDGHRARRAARDRRISRSSLVAGLAIMVVALRRVRSVTARRQLRWIVGRHLARRAAVRRRVTQFRTRSASSRFAASS